MIVQTQIVLNMSMPVSKGVLDRKFYRNHPKLDDFFNSSIANGDFPQHKHPLDKVWTSNSLINILLTWNNYVAANNLKQLWESLNTYNLMSIDIITLDEDRE